MHAYTMTADTALAAAYESAAPLMMDAAAAACRRDLADAVVNAGTTRREVATGAIPPPDAALLARHAMADRRPARERALDCVVDGLMAELRR